MSRETCYRCFWQKPLCWCPSITPMTTRTKFVFLMHPKEFKQEKAGTGRLKHLCLEQASLDRYPLPEQLLGLFHRMQDFQIRCAADPTRGGYRRQPYSQPSERVTSRGRSGSRREQYLGKQSA